MTDLPPPPPPPPDHLMPPPGYVPYGGFGLGQGNFQPIRALTKWLVILLVITLAVQTAALLVQITLRSSASDFINDPSSTTFDDKLGTYLAVALVAAVVAIGQLVVLIIWTFRMAKNLGVLGRLPQTFKPGITIVVNILGGCTLGIINFFMWRELWIGSDPDTAPGDPSWKRRPVGGLVVAHLVLTLMSVAVGFAVGIGAGIAGFNQRNSNDVATNLTDRFGVVLAAGALQIAVAVVFIMMVRQLAARHMQATREA